MNEVSLNQTLNKVKRMGVKLKKSLPGLYLFEKEGRAGIVEFDGENIAYYVNGESFGSIGQFITRMLSSDNVRGEFIKTENILNKHRLSIGLEQERETPEPEQEKCFWCNGAGRIREDCGICNGNGEIECETCWDGFSKCNHCDEGVVHKDCNECKGTKYTPLK